MNEMTSLSSTVIIFSRPSRKQYLFNVSGLTIGSNSVGNQFCNKASWRGCCDLKPLHFRSVDATQRTSSCTLWSLFEAQGCAMDLYAERFLVKYLSLLLWRSWGCRILLVLYSYRWEFSVGSRNDAAVWIVGSFWFSSVGCYAIWLRYSYDSSLLDIHLKLFPSCVCDSTSALCFAGYSLLVYGRWRLVQFYHIFISRFTLDSSSSLLLVWVSF